MKSQNIPGLALAVVKNGEIVLMNLDDVDYATLVRGVSRLASR